MGLMILQWVIKDTRHMYSIRVNWGNNMYAIQVRIDDPDRNCETGEHINKIFSIKQKTRQSLE